MKNTINKKSEVFASVVVIAILTISSICYSQVGLESKENNKQLNESGNSPINNTIAFQSDTIKGTPDEKIIKANSEPANKDNQIKSIDSTKYNMFGNLLNDDPKYNPRSSIWIPAVEVVGDNFVTSLLNTYILKSSFSRVGFRSWGTNLKAGLPWGTGWMWDKDRFANNFITHPFGGSEFFNGARTNGYNYWESMGFTLFGSYMWKIFGETGVPEREDLINTTLSGAMAGEVTYRMSSLILDDRTTGTERFIREFCAALVDPVRFVDRLCSGGLTRVSPVEVYQKEPINVEFSAGMRKFDDGRSFWTGPQNTILLLELDYGYPFEDRTRKPFDYFTGRSELNFGVGRKFFNSLTGEGILYGKNMKTGDLEMLLGLFQQYDYFDNKTFELGTISFGGGIMSRLPIYHDSYLFTNIFLAVVPFGGNSTQFGPDTTQIRDYNFVGGMETKFECGLNLFWGSIQIVGYYWWLRTYNAAGAFLDGGAVGNNNVCLLKPRITIRIYKNLSIGFEQLMYFTDRYMDNKSSFHDVRTEQKIYITVNVGNFKL
ncbi:MAG: DUF3943 domain-containing protein [FCB group bacterium]|jgi:hypothetical protein